MVVVVSVLGVWFFWSGWGVMGWGFGDWGWDCWGVGLSILFVY